ncbi:type II toxin-antitoxin system RelE/ParE family toxin [Bartonella sp. TT29SHDZB]|uniref:type II toxin-antitoxin system RelE/ParE family toxin n=2 Tax=unclassified Bartonella TaxID=2645622 RepID=UPI0035CEF50A
MAESMQVLQTHSFKKTVKKLHANQKKDLDQAVRVIMKTPTIGQAKTGDLSGVFVYKFKMAKQLTLLAYSYEDHTITLTLLALGSHENFYRDLKA